MTSPVQVVPSIRILLTETKGFSCCLFVSHSVSLKAYVPILVTLFGISISERFEQSRKAESSIISTFEPITTLVIFLLL